MSNRIYWYIIGNLIGLLLFGLAIHFKEGKQTPESSSSSSTSTSKTPAPAASPQAESR